MKFLFSLIMITVFFCSFLVLGFSKNRVKAEENEVPDGVERVAEDEHGHLDDESSILWAKAFTISVFHFPWATIHRARGEVESKLDRPYFHGSWGLKADVPEKEPKYLGGPFTGLFSDNLPDVKTQLGNTVDIDKCEAYGVIQGNNNVSNESFQAHAEIPFGDDNGGANNNANNNLGISPTVTSTNTGYSSSYGCDYNAEYDYCTDTGTCTTRSGEFGIGMCGHRWCCCAPEGSETSSTPSSTSVTSTNTGYSDTYGCDNNAEYDYCTDTGWCSAGSGQFEIGMCGHRWCCCAP